MRFSEEMVTKWRQSAHQAWAKQSRGDTPEGWSISPVDLSQVVDVFPTLRVKPGITLQAYRYRQGSSSHSLVFAMPAGEPLPAAGGQVDQPVRPSAALDDVMEAIDGDSSLESYIQASILRRELYEFGAFGHGSDWDLYHVLGHTVWADPPLKSVSPTQTTPSGTPHTWEWSYPQPDDYEPSVEQKDSIIQVIFYVYSALGSERIIGHMDTFQAGKYTFQTDSQTIATGQKGYVL